MLEYLEVQEIFGEKTFVKENRNRNEKLIEMKK